MSDTPRTDDAWDSFTRGSSGLHYVASKMRELERELKESKDEWGEIADSLSMREAELGDALARVKVLEELATELANRIGMHDGCSRYGTADMAVFEKYRRTINS